MHWYQCLHTSKWLRMHISLSGTPVVDIQTMTPPTMMPSTTPYPPGMPDPCDTSFDAVFLGADDVAYFFTGKYYWTVVENGDRNGPFNVTDKWGRLPSSGIDAAYQVNGNITFFKGKKWVTTTCDLNTQGSLVLTHLYAISKSILSSPFACFSFYSQIGSSVVEG